MQLSIYLFNIYFFTEISCIYLAVATRTEEVCMIFAVYNILARDN